MTPSQAPGAPSAAARRSRAPGVLSAVVVLLVVLVAWPVQLGGRLQVVVVAGTSMQPLLHTGDLVLTWRAGDYRVGDVVAYRIPAGEAAAGKVIIHRITAEHRSHGVVHYRLQGDNRDTADFSEPTPGDVLGRMLVHASGPAAVFSSSPELPLAVAVGAVVTLVLWPRRRPAPQDPPLCPGCAAQDADHAEHPETQLAGSPS